ncbi:hypothetical protein FA15DRAFT_671341 [Coprinopsis marcescibilis]|uniref:BTB domain-containing protein n=1 Tax=Coprinopsis marcescibilis TaxID=230819 RepID=A0A5C3KQ38_COPMA|nr:hypothetical protein FA15DRAFT_671341 [Coprinopsis marcescibilis]
MNTETPEASIEVPSSQEKAVCPFSDCDIPIDVVFQSSDGVMIGGHLQLFSTYSEGFPSSDVAQAPDPNSEPVPLPGEDSTTLKLLFKLMHKRRHADCHLEARQIGEILNLAEAAEKYFVFHLMEICRFLIVVKERTWKGSTNAVKVLAYATKNNYWDIVDTAAPGTVGCPPTEFKNLSVQLELAWFRYRQKWLDIAEFALTQPQYINAKKKIHECNGSIAYFAHTFADLPRTASAALDLLVKGLLPGVYYDRHSEYIENCSTCRDLVAVWKSGIRAKVAAIPTFKQFYV